MQELTLNSFALAARACAFDTLTRTEPCLISEDPWVEGYLQNVLDVLVVSISGNSHNPYLVRESIRILASTKASDKDKQKALSRAIGLARKLLAKRGLSEYDVWKSKSESE